MHQTQLISVLPKLALILGAGARRGVSYANIGDAPSPLDADFFDLLQRLTPRKEDRQAVRSVLSEVQKLPYGCWRSMERAFYTVHLRAYMQRKLEDDDDHTDETVIKNFAHCVQALLRKAHAKSMCANHKRILENLYEYDTVFSFNYDLVPERAMRPVAESRDIAFSNWLYGLAQLPKNSNSNLPLIIKLHGSSNWKATKSADKDQIDALTKSWKDFDLAPGYVGHKGTGTIFPIFLPFWEKRIEREPWLSLWQTAFKRLQQAEIILVWGYSLPTTDIKAQHLFDLTLARRDLKLCVVDPSQETCKRWRELLPRAEFWTYPSVEFFFQSPPQWWRRRENPSEE